MPTPPAPPHAIHFDAAPEASDFLFGSVLGQGSYAKVRFPPLRLCEEHISFASHLEAFRWEHESVARVLLLLTLLLM